MKVGVEHFRNTIGVHGNPWNVVGIFRKSAKIYGSNKLFIQKKLDILF